VSGDYNDETTRSPGETVGGMYERRELSVLCEKAHSSKTVNIVQQRREDVVASSFLCVLHDKDGTCFFSLSHPLMKFLPFFTC
jgi:hypothetical protein